MRLCLAPFALLVLLACSSSSSSPAAGTDGGAAKDGSAGDDGSSPTDASSGGLDTGGPIDAGGCGPAFYPNDYEPSCQLLLDKYCCDAEKACGNDQACMALVKCINDCAPPRDQTCIDACGTSGQAKLGSIATCTKTPPYTVPVGLHCDWPK